MQARRTAAQVLIFGLLFLACAREFKTVVHAQTGPASSGDNKHWSIEDMILAERAEHFRFSADAKWAVWIKAFPEADKDEMVSNIFLSSLAEKKEIQLTRGPNKDSGPKWSPDGQLIAFLSDRPLPKPPSKESPATTEPAKIQLWLINPFGGEPWPATRLERAVKDFDWIDAETILLAAEEDLTLYERTLKEKKDDSRAVEDTAHTPPVRLFKLNVKTLEMVRLTENNDWIGSVAVSPDGKKVVAVHARSLSYEFDQRVKPVTYLYDLASGKGKQIFTDGRVLPSQVRWTPDSSGFYAVSPFSTHPIYRMAVVNQLYFCDLKSEQVEKVDLGWENELGLESESAYSITPDGFVALLAAGARYRPARFTRGGGEWKRAWLQGEDANNLFALEIARDGKTLVYKSSSASRPEQWFRATLEGVTLASNAQLTALNPKFQKKVAAKSEVVRWKGSLDEEVEGLLYYPQGYKPGTKNALVVMIHGGPLGADMDSWDEGWAYAANLCAQRGAFVFKPNYHGSGNYGLKWAESIAEGKYYDLEVPDIEKGVDSLIARGLVDPERLGVLGWSNGAILTIALTVNSTRYKVASAGAGDVEWISDWGNVDFGASFDNYYLGKSPLEDPELYLRKSPVFRMKDVRTPTLIFFGTEDRNVPPSQGWTHFRALQQLGKTDVRFVLFPGEPHGPRKLSHQRRKLEEEMAWLDKYLFKPAAAKNEALKDDSPLSIELKRKKIRKAGTQYGVLVKATLVPEVVRYQDLEIGRFEVTHAQYATFDKNYKVEPSTENYPANGIAFENAQAYCAWLSKLTGETYRLGSMEEMETIYKSAKEGENTLNFWAGYNVNPDDAARLEAKIRELGSVAPLLKEVGSFKGLGDEELVFDLGGNVAEWAVDKNGKGKALGGSADRPVDAKMRALEPAPAYIGIRVVRGAPKSLPAK